MTTIAHRWSVPKRVIEYEIVYGWDGRPWQKPVERIKKGNKILTLPR